MSAPDYVMLTTAADADEYVSDADLEGALEWFADKRGVPTEGFIDRLCGSSATPYDLGAYDNEAARRLLSRARKIKREMDESL